MKKGKHITILWCCFFSLFLTTGCFSQSLVVRLWYGQSELQLGESGYTCKDNSRLQINVLKFYLSNIQLLKDGKPVFSEKNSHHLINAEVLKPIKIQFQNSNYPDFNQLRFNFGIDSITNVSGALGGDLDPLKGMYWTWQSGYINFKLEGKSPDCPAPDNRFQFHLGGYSHPFNCLQTVTLAVKKQGTIYLDLDIKKFLDQINLAKKNQIMSPSLDGIKLSGIIAQLFSVAEK